MSAKWVHNQSLNLQQFKTSLEVIKKRTEEVLKQQQEELKKYTKIRDKIKPHV